MGIFSQTKRQPALIRTGGMSDSEIFLVILGGTVAGAAIIVLIFARVRLDKGEDAWRKFADRHGLRYDTQHGEKKRLAVYGDIDGHEFLMERVEVGGQNKSFQTHVFLALHGRLPKGMTLGPERFGKGFLKKALVGKDVEVGDKEFDDKVLVRADDPEHLKEYLNSERKRTVRRLIELQATIEDGKVLLKTPKMVDSISDLETMYADLGAAAKVLSAR